MVCDDCKSKLSVISAPDPWAAGSSSASATRKVNENKLLRKGIRSNPYGNACKICKLKCQQNNAMYCGICAYAKGMCAICGKQVLDTSMYKMSEGGIFGTVRKRDPKSFKSPEQMQREEAQEQLMDHLSDIGQVGRMPTRSALEASGKQQLAETLVTVFGGLNAAADALGLSKRNLIEEADAKREAKQAAAQEAKERQRLAQEAAAAAGPGAAEGAADDADDAPPGINREPAAAASAAPSSGAAAATAPKASAAPSAPRPAAAAAAAAPASDDDRWQFDPNTGYHYQLSSGCYFDSKSQQYFKDGKWSAQQPK